MFEKIKELGVGSFGVVYLVKCMQNSVIRSDGAGAVSTSQSAQGSNTLQTGSGPGGSVEKGKVVSKISQLKKGSGANVSMASANALTTSSSSNNSFLSSAP